MITPMSRIMEKNVESVLAKVESNYFIMDCTLYSSSNPSVNIQLRYVPTIEVHQDFVRKFADEIQMVLEITAPEAILLCENYQDLLCTVKYTRVNLDPFEIIDGSLPISFTYRVVIANAGDLLKQYTKSAMLESDEHYTPESVHGRMISMSVQLIEKDLYDLRKKQINALLKDCTVLDVIYYVLNALGIKNISMIPPHNKQRRKSFLIPPMHDLTTIFEYIQENFGIYSKGVAHYYTGGVFYIYPPYETKPDKSIKPEVTHIYNVPSSKYLGMKGYHYKDGDVMHLVNNVDVQSVDMATKGAEIFGTYRVTTRTDMALDIGRTTNGAKGTFSDKNILGCGLAANRSMSAQSQGAFYESSTNNAYVLASQMAEYECTILSSGWLMSEPFTFIPGERVHYHFDKDSQYQTTEGVVESVRSTTRIFDRKSRYIYTVDTAYVLRLSPDDD